MRHQVDHGATADGRDDRTIVSRLVDEVAAIVGDEASHGMTHALNTMDLATRIGRVEGGDLVVIRAAALLHDIGRRNVFSDPDHGRHGARLAREILDRLDVPADRELICEIISRHDDPDDAPDGPIELAVVKDADRLELLRIAPDYLDLGRLITDEALRQVPYALRLHYGTPDDLPAVGETIRRAREILERRGATQV
jgi:putative nucleotidyltransferase with HDIG domain